MSGKMNTDGEVLDVGDCGCKGEGCSNGFGWVWNNRDLGHTVHRGQIWATPCPQWPKEKRVMDPEKGHWRPPAPPGITEENMHRYLQAEWASKGRKASKTDAALDRAFEQGKTTVGHNKKTGWL